MPFRWLQYLISLIPNRAILFDINDIKECHANLTESRLPTIKSYRIHHRKKGGEQEPPRFLEIQKGRAAEKKEGGKGASLRSSDARISTHLSRKRKFFIFFWILIKILTKIQKRAIIMSDFSDNNRIYRYVPILRLLRRGHHLPIVYLLYIAR